MKRHKLKKLLSSFGSGDDDGKGVVEEKEEIGKMVKKMVELINTKDRSVLSEDGSEMVSLVKSFYEGYQKLYGRYDLLVGNLKKSAYSEREKNGAVSDSSNDDDDDGSSLDSNSSDFGDLESENERLKAELELAGKCLSENSRLVLEIECLKLKLDAGDKGEELRIKGEEIEKLSLKNDEILRKNEDFKKEVDVEVERLRSELSEGDRRRSCLVEEICVLNSKISKVETEYEIAEKKIKEMKAKEEIVDEERKTRMIKLEEIQKRSKNMDKENETLEVKFRLATQRLKITETQHKATDETRTQRMEELVQEKTALQQQILGLHGKANHMDVQTKGVLVIESSRLSDIVHSIETVFDRSYGQFKTQATKLSEELGGMKEMVKALREGNGSLQLKLEGKVEEVEGLKKMAKEKDEEKREVIRQLCYQIEYHRDKMKKI